MQDIHSISSLLKMYFRELPNPLLTYQLYDKFIVSHRFIVIDALMSVICAFVGVVMKFCNKIT